MPRLSNAAGPYKNDRISLGDIGYKPRNLKMVGPADC